MSKSNYTVAEMADVLHQAASLYMASCAIPIDYGTGELYTAVEVHMLKYIIDHPGKNVTALSREWDKTRAAISMMLKKLESKGLISHETAPDSLKKQLYFATAKGLALNTAHCLYDERVFGESVGALREIYSEDDLQHCFKFLVDYAEVRRRKHYRAKES